MAKLKEEFKQKWIAALRSGEYAQCTEHLELDGGYCCLGVALKVQYPEADPETDPAFVAPDEVPRMDDVSEWWESLPSKYANNPTVKLDYQDDEGGIRHRWIHLSELNDEEGYTFEQIADIIEEQL